MTTSVSASSRGGRLSNIGLVAMGAGAFFIMFVAAVTLRGQGDVTTYLRDPATVFQFSPFAGIIWNIGVLCTFSAGVVCLFASAHGDDASLLRAVGLFGLLIATDDLLMLHEEVFPHRLGIWESVVFLSYFLIAAGITLRFRARLFSGPISGLMLAVALLGASVAVDVLFEYSTAEVVVEDGFKFVGLVVWSVYWISRAGAAVATARA